MKKLLAMKRLLIVLFAVPVCVFAQNKALIIEGVSPDLYINHTVASKENYYSIGRIYNISPKEVAPYNKLVLESGLSLGQALKIPLTDVNFLQSGAAASDEVLVPVYHTVAGKEGLYRISTNYNKLPLETLKKWNNLKSDAVANGTNLIVGYLKVKKELSPLASMAKAKPADNIEKVAEVPAKPIVTRETPKQEVSNESTPVVKTPAKENPVVVAKVKKEPVETIVAKNPEPVKKVTPPASNGKGFDGGAFKSEYEKQVRNKDIEGETGEAAIFKSTSGWEDGKYYCLHNSSTPGTIIKITSSTTGKSIYAKVLDVMPDIKQNTGLLVRLSNAAAQELGTNDAKFVCSVSYSK